MSRRPFCPSSLILIAELSWTILSCIPSGPQARNTSDRRCSALFHRLEIPRCSSGPLSACPPALWAPQSPALSWAFFRSALAAEGWDVQDDTSVEIFMNELCWMNFSLCVQANKSVNEAENSCNWLMVSGVLDFLSNHEADWWLMHHKYTKRVARRNKASGRGGRDFILWYLMKGLKRKAIFTINHG